MKFTSSYQLRRINNIIRHSYCTYSTHGGGRNVLLCPGQSSQYVGMITQLSITTPKMKDMVKTANKILGYDIVGFCQNGPDELLSRTIYCQPAVVIATLLAHEVLKENVESNSGSSIHFDAVAGYSVGEISALYLANILSYEETIVLLKERANAMDYACSVELSGMLSLQGLAFDKVRGMCEELSAADPSHSVSIAIEQYPKAVSLGGSLHILNKIMNREHKLLKDEQKIKLSIVNVSGAFHTKYMIPAQERLENIIQKLHFQPSSMDVYCNVTGTKYYRSSHDIPGLLIQQLAKPVLWNTICENVELDNPDSNLNFYEVGPGKQLKSILSKIDRKFVRSTKNIFL